MNGNIGELASQQISESGNVRLIDGVDEYGASLPHCPSGYDKPILRTTLSRRSVSARRNASNSGPSR